MIKEKEKKNRFITKLQNKYRFVIMNADTFEEKLSIRLSRFNVILFCGFIGLVIFISALLMIAYTPLREYVPGKSSSEVQKKLILLSLKTDTLEQIIKSKDLYITNINNIISGENISDVNNMISSKKNIPQPEISFNKSEEDSLLRIHVESNEKGSLFKHQNKPSKQLIFFNPVPGVVTEQFSKKLKHYGVDIVAKEKTHIKSVLGGTVIFSQWTIETGYVIGVQHIDGFISFYKHNSLLLKEVGDFVNAGDHIAIIGNSGELSSGPHLHFELWYKGTPVNPKNYISF